jgi:hypothetical protein
MPYLSNSGQLGEFWTNCLGISRSINQPDTNGESIVGLDPSNIKND